MLGDMECVKHYQFFNETIIIGDVSKKAYGRSGMRMWYRAEGGMRIYDTYALRSDYLFCN